MVKRGRLILIPVPLGEVAADQHLPKHLIETIADIRHFVVENERSARRFLVQVGFKGKIDDLTFHVMDKNSDPTAFSTYLQAAMGGDDIGLISEAGNPCIADPGAQLVELAHRKRVEIVPLVGPSSILLALISSGMNGQKFRFHGYLPKDRSERKKALLELEKQARKGETQLFMEVPFRNNHMIEDVMQTLAPDTQFCVATDLTLPTQTIISRRIKAWTEMPDLHKRPTIFLIGQ